MYKKIAFTLPSDLLNRVNHEMTITNMSRSEMLRRAIVSFLSAKKSEFKGKDLLNSRLIGIWKERKDIKDSVKYARQLRKSASNRRGIYARSIA